MKPSIAITLIITAAVFGFVSGYSIGSHSGAATKNAPERSAPAGGYGTPGGTESNENTATTPGYGAPSPGYGQ